MGYFPEKEHWDKGAELVAEYKHRVSLNNLPIEQRDAGLAYSIGIAISEAVWAERKANKEK